VAVPTWSWPGLFRLIPAIPIIGQLHHPDRDRRDKPGCHEFCPRSVWREHKREICHNINHKL
jgi:hypothetical protein